MKLWEWIVAAVVLFLVWGKLSKKVVPVSCIAACRPVFPLLNGCSSGDNFQGGKTTVAGVCEPNPVFAKFQRIAPAPAQCGGSVHPVSMPHVFFPVNPPLNAPAPVANPPAAPMPVLRRQPSTVFYSNSGGNGPGWCVDRLDQLANNPGCRNIGSGCGTF